MTETATAMQIDDDERHRREEQERRNKRKASKSSLSEEQKERDRRRREYRQKILEQTGQATSQSKKTKSGKKEAITTSAFQESFAQRAQGFQIDFRFRNAPPRPPVGPCFSGDTLSKALLKQSKTYRPFNAVEAQHVWKLHCESDLGVPLAPSAMDLAAYSNKGLDDNDDGKKLHPDDAALLNWKGSMGDTAADQRQARQTAARETARQWLKNPNKKTPKKTFSRVLKEDMQTWMKKTTYLSNDYTRKVHDFKSLAQTKHELAIDLQTKQQEMAQRRSLRAVQESFEFDEAALRHPTRKTLKPKSVLSVLPDSGNWGRAFTHVVIDKPPLFSDAGKTGMSDLRKGAFVANVEKREQNARMSCQIVAPYKEEERDSIIPVQTFDLDVIPLKEEDAPHANFCIWVDRAKGIASYLPISSRIQLSTGRPVRGERYRLVERRPLSLTEEREMEERMAEVDREMAEKHQTAAERPTSNAQTQEAAAGDSRIDEENDDGEGDFGDDDSDSDEEQVFGGGAKTIVAEG